MAAGISAYFVLGGVSGIEQAGAEIIPSEPDQRSGLRKKSPQCPTDLTPLSLSGMGSFKNC